MLRKTTALLLLIVLLFTNNVIAVQSAFDYTLQPSTGNAPGSSNFDSNVNNAVGAGNSLANAYINEAKESANIDWLRRLELNLAYDNTLNTWLYGISTIQPFAWSFDPAASDMLFFQLNAQKNSTNTYGNAGLGYRTLFSDRKSLVGLNAFFDEDFQTSNQRIGAGIEYFNRLAEVRANGYYGISKPKFLSEDDSYWYYQQVTNGFDYGVSLNVPSAEWLKLNATGYTNMYQYVPWTTGAVFDLQAQVLPQLRLEYGYNISSGTASSTSQFFKFNFNLGGVIGPVLFGSDNETKAIVDKDLSYKLLQPVQRNNIIVTENYKVAKTGNIYTYVAYSDTTPVPTGTVVSAASTTGSVQMAATNSSGMAVFSNLPTGNYVVSSNIGGQIYFAQPNPITVVNAANATAIITGPTNPATGELNVTFTYTDTTVITGATVTINNGQGVTAQATTNSSGLASFIGLTAGTYSVSAALGGNNYPGNPVAIVNGQAAASAIPGPNNPGKGYANITVQYNDGQSVADNNVVTMTSGGATATALTLNGIAAFVSLLPGTYMATSTIPGMLPANNIQVAAANVSTATITGAVNPTPTTGAIFATLKYVDGTPIANVDITAQNADKTVSKSATTAIDGTCTISSLLPGAYSVSALISQIPYFAYGNPKIVEVSKTTLTSIQGPRNPQSGSIILTYQYTDGQLVLGTSNGKYDLVGGTNPRNVNTIGGSATIQDLAPGNYQVTMQGIYKNTVSVTAGNAEPLTVTGPDNPDKGKIRITVVSDNVPAKNQSVIVNANHQTFSKAGSTGSAGEPAEITNLPPTYTILINNVPVTLPETYTVVSYLDGLPYYSPDNPVALVPQGWADTTITINSGYLKMLVTYGDGTPIKGQPISIQGLYNIATFSKTVTTNSTGYVAKENETTLKLPIGNYTITTNIYGVTCTSSPDPVVILESNTANNPRIANIAGPPKPADFGTIIATALYGDKSPMYGWDVKAVSTTDAAYSRTSSVDTSGVATFANLKSGQYYIYINHTAPEVYPPNPATNWISQPTPVICQANNVSYCDIPGPATPGAAAVIQVTARYANGLPMVGWPIKSVNTSDKTARIAFSDANGQVNFKYSTSGQYYVYIRHGADPEPFPPTPTDDYIGDPNPVTTEVGRVDVCQITGP